MSQSKVTAFESTGFVLEDGIAEEDAPPPFDVEMPLANVEIGGDPCPRVLPKFDFLNVPPSAYKFTPGSFGKCDKDFSVEVDSIVDGNKRPTMRNSKLFDLYHILLLIT